MEKRLENLESKVIVGGINLVSDDSPTKSKIFACIMQLEEAEKQDKLLEKSRKELEKKKAKEAALREKLKQKKVNTLNIQCSVYFS